MSLLWRSLSSSALVAGLILAAGPGCKSGGGWWTPGWAKWGEAGSSTSDLAVSRPPTRVPNSSGTSSAGGLASARGAQSGPYGANSPGAGGSSYDNQPAAWQGEPHGAVAPTGGYQTGGPYTMAARPQPGVTPGAYSQPYGQDASPEARTADRRGQTYPQDGAPAGNYGGEPPSGVAGAAPADAGYSDPSGGDPSASVYQDPNAGGAYAPPDAGGYGAPPPSDAPGAVTEPAADSSSVYGDGGSLYGPAQAANPAAAAADPSATSPPIANPYTEPAAAPATSPRPTTSPATSTAPFTPPTLPSSLSGAPGGYRPGSTAAPGSRYGVQNTIYEPPVTASGTGYSTADGTRMR